MHYRVFTKKGCGTCKSVVAIMKSRNLDFSEIDVGTDAGIRMANQLGVIHSGAIIDENGKEIPIDDILKITVQPTNA